MSLGPFMVDMLDITTSVMSPTLGPSVDPGVVPGATKSPYLAHRFRSGHIPLSAPFVEFLTPLSWS